MREIERGFGGGEGFGVVLEERDKENRGSFDTLGGKKKGRARKGIGFDFELYVLHLYRL